MEPKPITSPPPSDKEQRLWKGLPRNVWAVTFTSFLTDISSEMLIHLLPFFLANVLGAGTAVIGLIEGVAESTASLLKIFSGYISDKLRARKWLAVSGYALSTLSKPFYLLAQAWGGVMAIRVTDRIGKGLRTAPRDALIADSIDARHRGLAFGLHRMGDTAGAMLGTLIAAALLWRSQRGALDLAAGTFRTIVLWSLIPAALAVLVLAFGAREVPLRQRGAPKLSLAGFDRRFLWFLGAVVVFTLGNSSDAFLLLRARERGLGLVQVLLMVASFNLIYTLISGPAGVLSDKIGRRRIIVFGWLTYGVIYLGFAVASAAWQMWALYALYGAYYGMTEGTAKALVADLVPAEQRGTAYGVYNAAVGLAAFPASAIAGVLWQGAGGWQGFGPAAPFFFGAALALIAALWLRLILAAEGHIQPSGTSL